ncbi:MAG: hypothetical protein H6819_01865 [Phycisphaerales bacterium]|nr:hypothetical protein [Phycisphaerales bacterium]MCB9857043.1 hypothetical protein [Phycisphaerales bacterium]MCB9861830.1 hypothetical protein [Phycisphaerales bacterium]
MDAAAISAQTNSVISEQRATTRGFNDISSEDFFGLMIEELRSQDPLNPKDNQQLLQQMSNIRQMEQSQTLTKTLQSLSEEQRFGTTAGLIGNYVLGTVKDSAGVPTDIDGLVIGVSYEGNGNAILNLHNGRKLPASDVREVTLVENLPPDILNKLEAELAAAAAGETPAGGDATTSGDPATGDGTTSDGTGTDGSTTGSGDPEANAAARAIYANAQAARSSAPDRDAAAKLLNRIRSQRAAIRQSPLEKAIADGANIVGELLDSIFSPGIGVRTGG